MVKVDLGEGVGCELLWDACTSIPFLYCCSNLKACYEKRYYGGQVRHTVVAAKAIMLSVNFSPSLKNSGNSSVIG